MAGRRRLRTVPGSIFLERLTGGGLILAGSDRQLEAIKEAEADEPPSDLLSGTRKQWLKYRGQLSNWKEGAEFFPDQTHRPIRPV